MKGSNTMDIVLAVGSLAVAVAAPEMAINEVLADPARDWNGDAVVHSRDDEWAEIINLSGAAVDLTGWRLASADTTWRYEFSGTLPAGEVRVVYGSQSYDWERETGNPAFGLRLANGGGVLGLWQLTATDTVMVDQITYLDEEAEDDRSGGRLASDPDVWVVFDGLNPYDGEAPPIATGCPPTPGATNECLAPVRDEPWSTIKSLYLTPGRGGGPSDGREVGR